MKKIIATVPDLEGIDLSSLISNAIDFKVESVAMQKAPQTRKRVKGKTCPITIMEHFTPSGIFSSESAESWLEKAGFTPSSAGATLSKLDREGYLKRLNGGRFQFVRQLEQNAT